MNQIFLLIVELLICLSMLVVLHKKYGITGIYCYCAIAVILSNIMSLKIITLYEYDINLGLIPFITLFTSSNILIQKKGTEEAKKLLLTTITCSLLGYIILYLISLTASSDINLFTSASYNNIFSDSLKMYFASFVTILYSLLINIKLYYYLKKMKNNILISNIFSTIIIQFIASIIFGLIANIFTKDPIDIIKIIMIRYLVSLSIGIISTIAIYISNLNKDKE